MVQLQVTGKFQAIFRGQGGAVSGESWVLAEYNVL